VNIWNLVGQQLGQYELRELLGRGGMGVVYRAYQADLKREVALKVLAPALAEQPNYRARFDREAEMAAGLEHAHIIPVYDYGLIGSHSYVVMRLLEGGSLARRIARHARGERPRPTLTAIAALLQQVGSALDYAHSQNVIHRDVKPSNILFDRQGNAYLVDFGIAQLAYPAQQGRISPTSASYHSPEQWLSGDVTPAADQYALAITAFLLVTGHLPPPDDRTPDAVRIARPNVPDAVATVLARAMAPQPDERFPSVTDFAAAFSRALGTARPVQTDFFAEPDAPPVHKNRVVQTGVGIVLAALLLAVIVLLVFPSLDSESDASQRRQTLLAQTQDAIEATQTAYATRSSPIESAAVSTPVMSPIREE
jgi:serine/threonine protein kinase